MKYELNVTGTPAEIRGAIKQSSATARKQHPALGAVASSVSDLVGSELAGLGPDDKLAVAVAVEITSVVGEIAETTIDRANPIAAPINETQRAQAAAHAEAVVTTSAVRRLDGQPMVRNADGQIEGDPLNLTAEQRASIPPLAAAEPGAPNVQGRTSTPKDGTK